MKLIQWNSDAYDQDLVERTSDSCQGKVDVVVGCLGLGAPLQRSFKCLKKGGTVFVTEDINDKVLKSLQKLADQQNVNIVEKPPKSMGTKDDLKNLLTLVAEKQVPTSNMHITYIFTWYLLIRKLEYINLVRI